MKLVLLWIIYVILKVTLPLSYSMAVSNKTACPLLRIDGYGPRQGYREKSDYSGYDLAEHFSLRKTSCGGEKTCFKLGSTPLIKDTQKIFTAGLPEEYSITALFRVRRNTKKERWALWKTLTRPGVLQNSIIIDGEKKVVEFTAKENGGSTLHYTFKSRELHPLFDRQWHKLGISIEETIISLYVDCKLIERRQTAKKNSIDLQGRSVIVGRASDDRPVDIELQRITIYCSPKQAAQENCCEVSDGMCNLQGDEELPISSSAAKAQQNTELTPESKCYCFPNKGEKGSQGEPGSPGEIGEKLLAQTFLPTPPRHGIDCGSPVYTLADNVALEIYL
ncbi:collagen alpha-1(XIX) chain-like [Pyxicephalus adspersus]|uniref:collagen alpha-1(XIX) chain-like n=1 Tax=Pyxicephalus adspersus TaxID=30357 RepID=UPI003B58F954